MKELKMPRLRSDMEKGMLCAWLKEPGEAFEAGEPLFEVETDKMTSEVEAEESGIMGRQLVEEGDEVEVGTVLAEVESL